MSLASSLPYFLQAHTCTSFANKPVLDKMTDEEGMEKVCSHIFLNACTGWKKFPYIARLVLLWQLQRSWNLTSFQNAWTKFNQVIKSWRGRRHNWCKRISNYLYGNKQLMLEVAKFAQAHEELRQHNLALHTKVEEVQNQKASSIKSL